MAKVLVRAQPAAKQSHHPFGSKKKKQDICGAVEVVAASGASHRIALGCEELGGWTLIGSPAPPHPLHRTFFMCLLASMGIEIPLGCFSSHPFRASFFF